MHSTAPRAEDTDWRQILTLYDLHQSIAPSPVVELNRAVAVAEVEGPEAALALVDALDLRAQHRFHAIRADLLRRLDRRAEAERSDAGSDAAEAELRTTLPGQADREAGIHPDHERGPRSRR